MQNMSDDNCENRLKPSCGKGHFYIDSILHRKKHDQTPNTLNDGKSQIVIGICNISDKNS